MENNVIQLEHRMWEAVYHRDTEAFKELVLPDAVMICGGYRCSGSEYSCFIADFNISGYSISQMEVINSGKDEIILHYILKVDAENADCQDLAGLFHVLSIRKQCSDSWKLMLNMDSRIITR